ncbi:MAG: CHAP domain-containing protein [Verrucomicrobiales bacterium]|nr:CHAP domain-containing protein [Verrucomicrobiales bacterium]
MNRMLRSMLMIGGTLLAGGLLLLTGFQLVFLAAGKGPQSRAVWILGEPPLRVGGSIDMWRGVVVRSNGIAYTKTWGRHYAEDGYYYGQKWQCVEFMKRFYHDRMKHDFPDGMGHAAEFFDRKTPHGSLNVRRGLRQFINGGDEPPRVDDIIVWTSRGFGHVAIVCGADEEAIEIVQQNIRSGSRKRLTVSVRDGKYFVGEYGGLGAPAGWLRLKK